MTAKTRNLNLGDSGAKPSGFASGSSVFETLPIDRLTRDLIASGQAMETPFGNYRLIRTIGSGGMGQIYEAEHLALKKRVAIKFLLGAITSNTEAVVRFQRESQSIGQLDHPNILRATDAGCIDGLHYLVTDLLCGQDLAKWVHENGPLPMVLACEVIRQAALGLSAAHAKGFVHRDIKPSNLFLQSDGTIKLLDFGLVRESAVTDSETKSGAFLGTVDFLSPEQASHPDKASPQSDVYSLGCTWIHLLSGQSPYPDATYPSLIAKLRGHMMDQPEWLIRNERLLPVRVAHLIRQMIAKQPQDRPKLDAAFLQVLSNPNGPASDIRSRSTQSAATHEPEFRESLPMRTSRSPGITARILASLVRLSIAPAILLTVLWFTGFSITFLPFEMGDPNAPFQVIETSVSGPFPMAGTMPISQPIPMTGVTANPFEPTMNEPKSPPVQTSNNRQTQSAPVRTPGSKTLINRFAQPSSEPKNHVVAP